MIFNNKYVGLIIYGIFSCGFYYATFFSNQVLLMKIAYFFLALMNTDYFIRYWRR